MSKYKTNQSALSAINERDEYITLQDVLNGRSSWLKQEELWAVCRECCLTIKRISDSADIIQSLCVMLETLAFDSHGHVSFTDHEIEPPDPHYMPPEYEEIGNSCKGHIYSLGMLIYEASAYNSVSTKIPEHSARLRKLLNRMMDSDHGERVGLDAVVKECDQYFLSAGAGSSHDICKHLISTVNQPTGTDSAESPKVMEIEMNVDGDSPLPSPKSHSPLPSPTSQSVDLVDPISEGETLQNSMSLQYLVDKYTPGRLKEQSFTDSEKDSSSSSILSPPSEFGLKCKKTTMQSASSKTSTSAFSSNHTLQTDRRREVGEGATLRGGQASLQLPKAYSSNATHFSPIVLSNHDNTSTSPSVKPPNTSSTPSKADRTIKELKKQLLKKHSGQDGVPKVSPRQSLSPATDSHKSPQPSTSINKTPDIISPRSSLPAKSKQIIPSKPSTIVDSQTKKSPSIPVTQAVRPLPRKLTNKDNVNTQTNEPSSTSVQTTDSPAVQTIVPTSVHSAAHASQSNIPASALPSSVQVSEVTSSPAVSHAQPIVVNGATISSSPMISSYPTMPVMIQRDATTGAVSWLPVMANMPYWAAMSPQQAGAVNMMPTVNAPPATQMQTNASSGPPTLNTLTNQAAVSSQMNNSPSADSGNTTLQHPATTSSAAANIRASNSDVSSVTSTTRHNVGAANSTLSVTTAGSTTAGSTAQTREPRESRLSGEQPTTTTQPVSSTPESSGSRRSSKGSRSKETSRKKDHQKLLILTKIRQLLKNEFAFDGYMNHGQEDIEMAEFIGSLHLPALDFTNWCNIIVAKYGDLYWSEELLVSLYEVIHAQKPDIDRPPSGALRAKSARVLSVDEPGGTTNTQSVSQRFSTSPFRPIPLSESGLTISSGSSTSSSTPRKPKRSLVKPKAMLPQVHQNEGSSVDVSVAHSPLSLSLVRLKSASVTDLSRQHPLSSAGLMKSKSQILLQSVPPETRDLTPLVKSLILPNGSTRQVMYIEGKQANQMFDDIWTSPGTATSAFEQESDSHSHSSASELRVKGRLHNYSISNSLMGDEFIDSALGSKISSEYESDSSLASHILQPSNSTAICSTLVYASYMADNRETISVLSDKTARSVFISGYENKSVDGVKKKLADLTQQIAVNCKRRNKASKYVKKIHDSSQGKGPVDYKAMLTQIQVDYRDAVSELDYLSHAKLQLEVLLAEQASIDVSCMFSFTKPSRPLLVIETKENPRLQFQTKIDSRTNTEVEALYAGEPYGLLSYLYAKGALADGYILEFFHSYRYLLAAKDIMAFIAEKYNAAKELKPCAVREKVMKRSLDLLTFWVTSYYSADFILSPTVVITLVNFLQDEVLSEHQAECEPLLKLLDEYENDKSKNSAFVNPLPVNDTMPYLDEELNPLSKKWNLTRSILTVGSGKSAVQYQKTGYGIASYTPKSKKAGKDTITPSSSFSADSFSVTDYSASDLAEQLTLVDQVLFQNVHPVNFMNTLAQGIGASLAVSSTDTIPRQEKKPLFHSDYVQLVGVPEMIQHSKKLAHWVTAEIINATNIKSQTATVIKFLQIAKICKDLRNYATCMSIIDGLDHPLIRLIPAWKEIPTKLMQELEETKLLLKTNSDAIRPSDELAGIPTIPCALLFSLHVQQLEQGGFTLANGMFRWPKLKSLAKLVDLIRVSKNSTYKFIDNQQLNQLLRNRLSEMNTHNLETLVITASADSNRGGANGSSSRWSNVLKKVKGKFS